MPDNAAGRRVAIVTGGASGIGRALAEQLATEGFDVVLADRQLAEAERVACRIRGRGGAAVAVELDVRDAGRFRTLVEETIARTGRLDYLFNNAGIGVGGEAREFEPVDWDDVIDVNLRGVAHGICAAYPLMIRQGFGHIINTASMAGLTPVPLHISYTASKHAVVGLSKALRLEARRYGVRVSVLCPGAVRTPILGGGVFGRLKPGLDPAVVAALTDSLRPLDPARLARRVLRAVERDRAIIVEPPAVRALWYLDRLSPWLFERLAGVLLRRVQRQLDARRP
jgi:NAD(P)-dependent dehydrogenase (short-subunit alcohol dehydrogenase family)